MKLGIWQHRNRSSARRSIAGATAAALITGTFVALSASPAAALPSGGMSADAVNAMFAAYGDAGGGWTGGDNTASVALPDGRVVWLFADSFLGTVNADHSRPTDSPMVNNLMVVQGTGTTLTATRHGGTAQAPEALVKPAQAGEFYWAADGTVEGSTLKVFYNRIRKTGDGVLDFEQTGVALATFALPGLTLTSVTDLPALGSTISWGAGVLPDGGYTYVYGTSSGPGFMKYAHLARAPSGGLTGAWQFWTGTAWSADPAAVGRLISGVDGGGVQKVGSEYVWVTHENNLMFDTQFVAYTSTSPTGPFTGPIQLFTAPEASEGRFVYSARVHPDLARSGKLLVSYDVNTTQANAAYQDVRNGRPQFVEVAWPPPAPGPGLPSAPATPSITTHGDLAYLTWPAVAGATQYWLYQRDVTGGQTHFARVPNPVAVASAVAAFLFDGHTYEFRVAAENAVGIGPPSPTVGATIDVPPPAAPTGVTATADTTGSITVSWVGVPIAWGYSVLRRDVTLGETEFTPHGQVNPGETQLVAEALLHGHEYEFVVTAKNGGGTSPQSAPVRATAFYALPGAPTGLTATPQADGTIQLTWVDVAPGIWYWVYMRDVTAGDTAFTQLPLPATTNSLTAGYLTHGHEYEFTVAAINPGGEGPQSAVVRATAAFAAPPAPTGLAATPQADGTIRLAWSATDPQLWSYAYMRDVTAGEAEFTKLELPITTCCTFTAGYLKHAHEYEFYVVTLNDSGESAPSNKVRATAAFPLPAAPTNLQATAGDRIATLTWQSPDADAWHWVHIRDVTAGQTSFTRLELPVTTCCTFTGGELTNGHTYEFKVSVIGAEGSPDSALSAAVSATPIGLAPGAPSDLTGAPGNAQVTLTWTASPTPNAWYWVYMRDMTAGQASFTRLELPVSTCCTFTGGMLVNGHTYEFKMAAIGAAGSPDSGFSNVVSLTPVAPPPAAPSNLRASAGNALVALTWTASSTSNSWYWVYLRDATAGQAWQKLALPITTCCSFTATGLVNAHRYEFKVAAVGADGAPDSAPSNVAAATPVAPQPAPPTNVHASSGNGQVSVTWTASTTPGVWYWMYQRDVTAGEGWRKLELPISTCCSFTATGLVNGHTHEFKLKSIGGSGAPDSGFSSTATARPVSPPPGPPSNLRASAGNAKVTLTWNASSTPDAWYWVYYRDVTAGQGWQKSKYPVSTCCTHVAGYLVNGHTYEFKVSAIGSGGSSDSGTSNVVSARPVAPPPGSPTNLQGAINSQGIRLTWTASATPGAWYWIYQRNASVGQSWQRLQYPISTCCSFQMIWLSRGTHEFKIVAIGSGGAPDSASSNILRMTYDLPAAPSALQVYEGTYYGNRAAGLQWRGVSGSNVVYEIWAHNRSGGSWFKAGETTARSWIYPCPGESLFEFQVYARNLVGRGPGSNIAQMLGPDEGWQPYSPPRPFYWDKYSPWFFAGNTTEDCPPQGEYSWCNRFIQFHSKHGESYWRNYNGTTQRTFVARSSEFRYKMCVVACGAITSWTSSALPRSCKPRKIYGYISGVEPYYCLQFKWAA